MVLVNGGYQSITPAPADRGRPGFGNEFRQGPAGDVRVDYAANARSLGCARCTARTVGELEDALAAARACPRPAVVACHVEPGRRPRSGAWWDLGVPEVSARPEVVAAGGAHARRRAAQRFYG